MFLQHSLFWLPAQRLDTPLLLSDLLDYVYVDLFPGYSYFLVHGASQDPVLHQVTLELAQDLQSAVSLKSAYHSPELPVRLVILLFFPFQVLLDHLHLSLRRDILELVAVELPDHGVALLRLQVRTHVRDVVPVLYHHLLFLLPSDDHRPEQRFQGCAVRVELLEFGF